MLKILLISFLFIYLTNLSICILIYMIMNNCFTVSRNQRYPGIELVVGDLADSGNETVEFSGST